MSSWYSRPGPSWTGTTRASSPSCTRCSSVVLGEVDDDGAVRFGDEQVPGSIGVVDEITRRGWLSGARLLAVRRGDVPGGGDLAAILRYAT